MNTIKFTDVTGLTPDQFKPVPAKQEIPEWLKKMTPYTDKEFKVEDSVKTNQTAKRCIPMLDAVMMGYIIRLTHDLYVTQSEVGPYFQWRSGLGVDFHSSAQIPTHLQGMMGRNVPKLISPWSIETPAGYSTMFVPPLNSEENVLVPFSGVVDTDTYLTPVNFAFILEDGFEGIIHAGTPIIQAIPFKRESWKMELSSGETKKITKNKSAISSVFRNGYRKMFWSKKDYS